MVKTNKEKVVKGSVVGKVRPSVCRGWRVGQDGTPFLTPGIGGINYNVKLGDSAFGLAGDHIEPGVSLYHDNRDFSEYLNILSCIGNEAVVMSGDGKGRRGFVTGKHGGAEDVMVYFEDETLELLCPEDKVLIRSHGQGLKLIDYPEISAMNIDPELFDKLGIEENGDGTITVPVAAVVPPYLMGSGIGSNLSFRGDYDIMTHDSAAVKEYGIDKLRFGDLVLLQDCDNVYGRGFLTGATAIGVIIHSDCYLAGHGPGVTVILASQKPLIKAKLTDDANIINHLKF